MQLIPDLAEACVVPRRVSSPEEARAVVDAEGAAIVSGIADEEAAIAFGRAMLGRGPAAHRTADRGDQEAG